MSDVYGTGICCLSQKKLTEAKNLLLSSVNQHHKECIISLHLYLTRSEGTRKVNIHVNLKFLRDDYFKIIFF